MIAGKDKEKKYGSREEAGGDTESEPIRLANKEGGKFEITGKVSRKGKA
jgi:hypothetical protein